MSGRNELPVTAYLGFGGNIGDPQRAIGQALRAIDADPDCRITAVSSPYRTPPWGVTDQPEFVNACAAVETFKTAGTLLELALETEKAMHRVRDRRWGPRTIDIDILIYGEEKHDTEPLQIPHPRMKDRAFVLLPLAEIAPQLMPGRETIADLADRCDSTGVMKLDQPAGWWRND